MSILITVLLTILKVLGIILLVILGLILTALLIPVGAQIIFEGGKLIIKAKAGPISLTVFPWTFGKKKKPGKPQKQAKSKPPKPPKKTQQAKAQPEKPAAPAPAPEKPPEQPKESPKAEPKPEPKQPTPKYVEKPKPTKKARQPKKSAGSGAGGSGGLGGLPWEKITSALELLPEVLKKLFGSIRIYDIRLTVPIHMNDAAATAIWYGRVNGLIGGTVAAASHIFQVELKELNVLCDFTGEAAGKEHFSCKITTHLMQLVILGITTLIQLKKRKII